MKFGSRGRENPAATIGNRQGGRQAGQASPGKDNDNGRRTVVPQKSNLKEAAARLSLAIQVRREALNLKARCCTGIWSLDRSDSDVIYDIQICYIAVQMLYVKISGSTLMLVDNISYIASGECYIIHKYNVL